MTISRDGTCVNVRKEGWREAQVGAIACYGPLVAPADEEDEEHRERLRTVYLGQVPEEKTPSFNARFEREVDHTLKNTRNDCCVVCIADGSIGIWSYFETHPELRDAVHILDFHHAAGYLAKVSHALYARGHQRPRHGSRSIARSSRRPWAAQSPGPDQIFGAFRGASQILASFSAQHDYELAGRQSVALAAVVILLAVPIGLLAAPRVAATVLARQVRRLSRRHAQGVAALATCLFMTTVCQPPHVRAVTVRSLLTAIISSPLKGDFGHLSVKSCTQQPARAAMAAARSRSSRSKTSSHAPAGLGRRRRRACAPSTPPAEIGMTATPKLTGALGGCGQWPCRNPLDEGLRLPDNSRWTPRNGRALVQRSRDAVKLYSHKQRSR